MKHLLFTGIFFLVFSIPQAQTVVCIDSSQKGISFRGLSVVSDRIIWVSGHKGTVGKSLNGGRSFTWMHPAGFEDRDFRDIEAFDANNAIIMAIDSPAYILKTTDGGRSWKPVYEKHLSGIFLDALSFQNNRQGACVGDPIREHFWLVETRDGGDSWQEVPAQDRPAASPNEACFASSGTNLCFADGPHAGYRFVSGGSRSRLFRINHTASGKDTITDLPFDQPTQTSGANSLAIRGSTYVVVGGDFNNYRQTTGNSTYSDDNGKTWRTPVQPPSGYKSCVAWKDSRNLIATGLSGTDISINGPNRWQHISDLSFHVVQKAKKGSAIFLAGRNGYIGRYVAKKE